MLIIDPPPIPDTLDKMVEEMAPRRGKMIADERRAALMKAPFPRTMLVKMGVAGSFAGRRTTHRRRQIPSARLPGSHQDKS